MIFVVIGPSVAYTRMDFFFGSAKIEERPHRINYNTRCLALFIGH